MILARRLVAQRCLYGVDRNPVAVDLAKMSLWLVTLAREHPLTFLDHALRHGDSLVGLSPPADRVVPLEARSAGASRRSGSAGTSPGSPSCVGRSARPAEDISDWTLRDMWDEAQAELDAGAAVRRPRGRGFLLRRQSRRTARQSGRSSRMPSRTGDAERYRGAARRAARGADRRSCRSTGRSSSPRCSSATQPRVRRDRRKPTVRWEEHDSASANPAHYLDWLQASPRPERHGNADLVAHFFRRAVRPAAQ